jgi:hypothetical protein
LLCFVSRYFPLIFCSSEQNTALHFAALHGQTAACQLLISAEADVNATDWCAFMFKKACSIYVVLCFTFTFASDFVLHFSHSCPSLTSLQFGQDPPRTGSRKEQARRCGVA